MCAHYGWSWEYLHWGLRWPIMQRVLIDAPGYEMPKPEEKEVKEKKKLTKQNAKDIMNYINSLDS
ncbi:hypothetical protein BWI93_03090 [Siphonobacter sp. BAB-5385]|uniref:Uncharacterized protein n=1 Tax=Siphonobacter curvatus TaxID=2094562 RepID=A0A2S7ITN5_9BACT|nr:hypothetical protein BWI93_03090 [Siphonobacter sp. BAB-5385]PQA61083.1 hypothetical protein C5O19_11420 [Siphonobacter curvatus]